MKLKIISIGKIKNQYIQALINYYSKQIPRIEFIEVKDTDKESEGNKITQIIDKINNKYVYCLTEEGMQFDSVAFSNDLKKISMDHELIFIIGGPDGISDNLKKQSDFLLSLSSMTYTHEMAKLFLVEQLFRAQSIINKKSYHR
jgi:23S rRNA (pseudouridine1915-N3)-methyltransferase